ncbi:hypothetical protein HK100_010569, partial [Physocladia obscura]
MVGVVLGAFISSYISGFTFAAGLKHATPTIVWNAGVIIRLFFGGIAIFYGSRMAGGCTSGHGISGMAQLSAASLVTVISMFAGGTVTA